MRTTQRAPHEGIAATAKADFERLRAERDALIAKADAARAKAQEPIDVLQIEMDRLDEIVAAAEGRRFSRQGYKTRPTARNGKVKTDPHRAAGPTVIAMVQEIMVAQGAASQAKVTALSGKHSGSVSWAFKALEKDGVVRWTHERERGSKVYEHTGKTLDYEKAR